jgi:hypothetical protein
MPINCDTIQVIDVHISNIKDARYWAGVVEPEDLPVLVKIIRCDNKATLSYRVFNKLDVIIRSDTYLRRNNAT